MIYPKVLKSGYINVFDYKSAQHLADHLTLKRDRTLKSLIHGLGYGHGQVTVRYATLRYGHFNGRFTVIRLRIKNHLH